MADDYQEEQAAPSLSIRDYARVLFKRKWLILAFWITASVAGFVVLKGEEQIYFTYAEIQMREDEAPAIEKQYPAVFNFNIAQEMAFWNSPAAVKKVLASIEEEGNYETLVKHWFPGGAPTAREDAIAAMTEGMNTLIGISGKNPTAFSVTAPDPYVAQIVAGGYVKAFQKEYGKKFQNAYHDLAKIYDEEIAAARAKSASAEAALTAYLLENPQPDELSIREQAATLVDKIGTYKSAIIVGENQKKILLEEMNGFKNALQVAEPGLLMQWLNPSSELFASAQTISLLAQSLATMKADSRMPPGQIRTAERKRESALKPFQSSCALMIQDEGAMKNSSLRYSALATKVAQIDSELLVANTSLTEAETEQTALKAQIEELRKTTPAQQRQIASYQGAIRGAEEAIADLENRNGIAKTSASAREQLGGVDILRQPAFPANPLNGSWQLKVLFVSLAGFIIGILAAFILDMFDHSYDRADIIERELGLPVLATFPEEKQP